MGAEWWVQIRGGNSPDGEAIGFHWDRDEVLADEDPPQLVHPSVATVTYLTDVGAPTMVIEQPPLQMPADGRETIAHAKTAFLSQPAAGKHIAFDGRLLHGVPPELMLKKGSKSTKRRKRKRDGGGGGGGGGVAEKGRRITFLVNMWFDGKPTGIKRYPPAAARKHPLTRTGAKQLVPWERVPNDGPVVHTEIGKGQQCGFAFGRPEDEAHEMWLPISASSFGTSGQSVGLKFKGKGITIKRKPPDLAARRRVKEQEMKEEQAAKAIGAAAKAATPAASVDTVPFAQPFEDEDWDSDVNEDGRRDSSDKVEEKEKEEDLIPPPLPAAPPTVPSKDLQSQKEPGERKKKTKVRASATVLCSDAKGWSVEPC